MNRFFRYYVWQAGIPSLVALVIAWAVLLAIFIGISRLEIEHDEYSVFCYHFAAFGNMPFWVFAMCCEGIAMAMTIVRWSAIRVRLPIPPQPADLELQIPICRVVATAMGYTCGIALLFYPLKSVMTVIQ